MNDNRSTASDLALVITQAVNAYVKERPDVDVMQVCAALGAAGGALVSVSTPAGNEGADHTALDLMTHGFTEFLTELRKAMTN